MELKCKSCGYDLFPTDKTCDRCGTPVPVVVSSTPVSKSKPSQILKETNISKTTQKTIDNSKGSIKCANCGAIIGNSNRCEYCGVSISYNMKREREQLNKAGCPKCGSSNISFTREKQGELKGKAGTAIVRSTVGLCGDCGHTWE